MFCILVTNWISFAKVVKGFLGNKKDENHNILAECLFVHIPGCCHRFSRMKHALFSETLCTFNIISTAVDSYVFKADLNYIRSVCGTTFFLLFSFSAHLT
jgi:hypothetical protein